MDEIEEKDFVEYTLSMVWFELLMRIWALNFEAQTELIVLNYEVLFILHQKG